MSKGVATLRPLTPLPSGCRVSPVALTIARGLPFEDWAALMQHLFALREQKEHELETVTWWIGDAIRYGEAEYGERYAQAVGEHGLSYQRLANIVWVAEKFEPIRRREKLSFEHHAKVAALPAPEADKLLEDAEREGWSSRTLYEKRLDREAETDGKDADEARAERALDRALVALAEVDEKKWGTLVVERLLEPLVKKRWQLSQTVIALLEGV